MNYYQTSQMNRSCQNPRRSEAASRMNSCSAACRPAPRTENRSSNCRPAPRMENRSSDCRPAPRAENRSSDCQASHGSEHSSKRSLAMAYVPCLWATKKIFLLFLRMNSNPHHNYPVRKKPYFTRFFYCQSWTGGFRFPCFFFCVWEQGVLNSNQS